MANHDDYGGLYRALIAQCVHDLAEPAEAFDAAEWLFGTHDPVANEWRDQVCTFADINLDGLQEAVRQAGSDRTKLWRISEVLKTAEESNG